MQKFKNLILVALAVSLTSCGGDKEPPHTHAANNSSVEWLWAEDYSSATAVVKCADCGETLATLDNTIITDNVESDPTCTEDGKTVYTAKVTYEGLEFSNSKDQVTLKFGHQINPQMVAQVPAGCTTTGLKAHYECDACGVYFLDQDGEQPVEYQDLILPAAGHSYGDLIPEVLASCGHEGMEAHYVCSVCSKLFDQNHVEKTEEQLVIQAVPHNLGPVTSVNDEEHEQICGTCGEHVTTNHNYTYEQVTGESKHNATCEDCGHVVSNVDCSFEWKDNNYACGCGREAEITIPVKINLDLIVVDGILQMGPNATPFTISGAGEGSEITGVKLSSNGQSIWDSETKKLDDSVLTLWDWYKLDVEVTNGDNIKTFTKLDTQFVSKTITTEADLKQMSDIANKIAAKEKRYTGYFELGNDITLTPVTPNDPVDNQYTWGREHCMDCSASGNVSHESDTLNGFKGIFDGNGYTIYNLNTLRSYDTRASAAPFMMFLNQYGIIRNVAFHGCKIGGYSKFSLVAYASGKIENVYVAPEQIGSLQAGGATVQATGSSHLEVFFGGNVNKGFARPTLKNVVVEFNGATDCEFDADASSMKSMTVSGYIFSGDYHGRLPLVEDFVVLTTNTHAKNHLIWMDITNAHSDIGGVDFNKAKYESIRNNSNKFFISADNLGIVNTQDYAYKFDVTAKESRAEVYAAKGEEWATKWNAIWAEGSKAAVFDDAPVAPRELKVEKAKTENAALDNLIKVTETPDGTSKLQYSIDDGATWVDMSSNNLDVTLFKQVAAVKVQALDSENQVLDLKEVEIDKTWYVAGDAWFDTNTSAIGIGTNLAGGGYYKADGTATVTGAIYWKDGDTSSMPASNIKYNADQRKTTTVDNTHPTWHATSRLHYKNNGKTAACNSVVPGATERMWVNVNGCEYRLPSNSADKIPFGIKKVAVWAFFSNFVVTYADDTTENITKIYNKGFFMTPMIGAGSSSTVTGYMESSNAYSKIDGGLGEKEWKQFVYDVDEYTKANYTSFSTNYLTFTQTVTLGTLTGETADMQTALYGATFNEKVVKDFTFDVGLNCVQFVY